MSPWIVACVFFWLSAISLLGRLVFLVLATYPRRPLTVARWQDAFALLLNVAIAFWISRVLWP